MHLRHLQHRRRSKPGHEPVSEPKCGCLCQNKYKALLAEIYLPTLRRRPSLIFVFACLHRVVITSPSLPALRQVMFFLTLLPWWNPNPRQATQQSARGGSG